MSPLLIAPLLLSITLLSSGVAKTGGARARRSTQDAMVSLRLPVRAAHPFVAAVLPIGEIVLAVALWVPVRGVQIVVAALVCALMAAYLVVIARALRLPEPVSCACFGSLGAPTVSAATLARNIVLTALGVITVVLAVHGDLGIWVSEHGGGVLGWALALVVAVALTGLTLGGTDLMAEPDAGRAAGADATEAASASVDGSTEGDSAADGSDVQELEYERSPIPFGILVEGTGDGARRRTLQEVAGEGAQLMIWLSPRCGPCERVLARLPDWSTQLEPLIRVRTMFRTPVDHLDASTLERAGDHPSQDLEMNVATVLGMQGNPAAILLGVDGLTAGGPVAGADAVTAFVEEIVSELTGARSDGDLGG